MTSVQERPAAPESPRRVPQWPARVRIPKRLPLPRAPQTRSPYTSAVAWTLAAFSVILGWSIFYALAVSSLQADHSQGVLYSKLREQLAAQTAPFGGQITPGSPVALLTMKTSGLHDTVVVEGTASHDLMSGPGHRRDSPMPGQAGVSVLYGRSTMFGGPFSGIASAHAGDAITITTGQGQFTYLVQDVRRAGDPFPAPLESGGGRITLVTAESDGWQRGWAASHALYVDAALQGNTVATPPGRLGGVPKAETALQGDPSSLFTLVL
ncbi:MAG: sortase, partial [Pseudonocardiales bacterium]|nr:sortase [Pseudonocardiales bacterium]